MPLCPHVTITLIMQYNLISNYDVNCDCRFREVQLGNHISYPDVAKIYQVVISSVIIQYCITCIQTNIYVTFTIEIFASYCPFFQLSCQYFKTQPWFWLSRILYIVVEQLAKRHIAVLTQVYDQPKSWTSAFTRSAYYHPCHANAVVIMYHGDESRAGQFPHGNDNRTNRPFMRTQPHVIRGVQVAASATQSTSARSVYQSLITQPTSLPTAMPRNTTQIKNTLTRQRNKSRLTHDAMYNLMEFAHDSNFVRRIVTFPDLEVIMMHDSAADMLRSLLTSDPDTGQYCLVHCWIYKFFVFVCIRTLVILHIHKWPTIHLRCWIAQFWNIVLCNN